LSGCFTGRLCGTEIEISRGRRVIFAADRDDPDERTIAREVRCLRAGLTSCEKRRVERDSGAGELRAV
jgi:hypothetical protein